jgi:hypothetical protein
MGLFRDVRESEYALTEALANYARPSQLRFLFANLLMDLPSPGMELWTRFRQELCADYLLRHNDADAANRALLEIGRYLANRGSSPSVHGLPEPDRCPREVNIELDFFHPRRDEIRAAAATTYKTINPDQSRIFDTILQRLEDPELPDTPSNRPYPVRRRPGLRRVGGSSRRQLATIRNHCRPGPSCPRGKGSGRNF